MRGSKDMKNKMRRTAARRLDRHCHEYARLNEDVTTTVQAKSRQSGIVWNEEFPLEAYYAVYEWIDKWSNETIDPELRVIALATSESLHAVGVILLDTMRFMRTHMAEETQP